MLTSLVLHNFRNHKKASWKLHTEVTCVVGANAAGKTNILEAIMLLATGKSFHASVDREMISWGQEVAHIKGSTNDGNVEIVLTQGEVSGHQTPLKRSFVNGIPRRSIDVVGNIRAVLFWPEDLEIVTHSPSVRRRYLDTVLVQVDREYRRNLLSYERGIRQRNKLLALLNEGKATRSQLQFWDQLLIKTGGYITEKRIKFVEFVNTTMLAGHRFMISYDKSIISEARLAHYAKEEVQAKSTLVGPHRDDFVLLSRSHEEASAAFCDVAKYGSRGQQRMVVLWLKLAELSYIEMQTGERPTLLLDDIFSELDAPHRELIVSTVQRQQTIITSADYESVPQALRRITQVISI